MSIAIVSSLWMPSSDQIAVCRPWNSNMPHLRFFDRSVSGVGRPDDFDPIKAQANSLDIRLIRTLSAPVGRDAEFWADRGTRVVIANIRGSIA